VYRGGASRPHPTDPADVARGLSYDFFFCLGGSRPGDLLQAADVRLLVLGGDAQVPAGAPRTEVTVTLAARSGAEAPFRTCCPPDRPISNPTTGLCEPACADPTPWYDPDTQRCAACPADTPTWDPALHVCKASCPGGTAAGGDAPVTRAFELGANQGIFDFRYETYSVKDRILVKYEDGILFDTGCVGANGTVPLAYSGASSLVVVQVLPNCEGTTGTAWNFSVSCPR
jgi:hypothetical protein